MKETWAYLGTHQRVTAVYRKGDRDAQSTLLLCEDLELPVHALAHGVVDFKRPDGVADVGGVDNTIDEQKPVGLVLGVKLKV